MLTSESIGLIAKALAEAQKEMDGAVKSATNPFYKSKYTDLNSVREACIPALNKHGISVLQPTITIDGKPFVETILLHSSGEYIGGQTEIICAKINDPQAHGSGVSYARRYGLNALVCLGSEDDDGESAMSRTPKAQAATPLHKAVQAQTTQATTNTVVEAVKPVETVVEVKTAPAPTKFVKPSSKVTKEEVLY